DRARRPHPRRVRPPRRERRSPKPRRGYFFVVVLFFSEVVRLAGAFFFAGPFARLSASFSTAMVSVISSTFSVARRETFVVPSVMYGPKRPSLITIGFSLVGSVPSSFSGGFAAA